MPKKAEVKMTVTNEEIQDLICTCFEGGDSPWIGTQTYVGSVPKEVGRRWYDNQPDLMDQPGPICLIEYDDPDEAEGLMTGSKLLTRADFERGLALMASDYPTAWGDFRTGNMDAFTGDAYMQLVVLGDVVYG